MKTVYTATETIDKHINDGISRVRGIIVKEQTRVVEDMDAYRDKMLAFGMETETFSHVKTHGWVFSCFKNGFIYRSVVVKTEVQEPGDCNRCKGSGVYDSYRANGECFACKGSGVRGFVDTPAPTRDESKSVTQV